MKQANSDKLFAILATIGVITGVVAGFWLLGSPSKQRLLRTDQRRLDDLYQIADNFYQKATINGTPNKAFKLPNSLPETENKVDPFTAKPYQYQRLNNTQYKLCAEFDASNNRKLTTNEQSSEQKFWQHPAGLHCYQFDVFKPPIYPDYYY